MNEITDDNGDITILPCGCITGTKVIDGVPTFLYAPCSLTCEYYRYAITQAGERNVPIEYKIG